MNSIADMERRLPRMEADVRMYQARVADLREQAAAAAARIAAQRRAMESARAEAAELRAEKERLEARVAQLESGPEPIQATFGRPSRPDGASAKLAARRPLFAQALARRDELVASEGLSRAEAWARLMEQEPGLREALIDEAARNGGGER